MTFEQFQKQIELKYNSVVNAYAIQTLCKKIEQKIQRNLEDEESVDMQERYEQSLVNLKEVPKMVEDYSKTADRDFRIGDSYQFIMLQNWVYDCLDILI